MRKDRWKKIGEALGRKGYVHFRDGRDKYLVQCLRKNKETPYIIRNLTAHETVVKCASIMDVRDTLIDGTIREEKPSFIESDLDWI